MSRSQPGPGSVADRRPGLTPPTGDHAHTEATDRVDTHRGRRPGTWRVRWGRFGAWLAGLLVLLVAASVAGLLPLQIMRVGSGSMAPTIDVGDLVVVQRSGGPVRRMDVVAVDPPAEGALLVKRAVALGGDTVAIEDGVLVVNGARVCERAVDQSRIDGVYFGPVTVPAGQVFLLGDERSGSVDSRDFGPLDDSAVVGVVRVRLWPGPGALPADRC